MPILLEPPKAAIGGPDGQGWNRLNSGAHFSSPIAQCALQPNDYAQYVESLNTFRASWGHFGRCVRPDEPGDRCGGCPVLTKRTTLQAFGDRVLVRVNRDKPHIAYLMNRAEDGWASRAEQWTWTDLTHLAGWHTGETYHDEHGHGFWLVRDKGNR